MKKVLLAMTLFVMILAFSRTTTQAQTAGTLTFSVTTTEPAGNYYGDNVIALWVEDTSGTFVKTKIRYAGTRIQYLNKWITASSYNTTDAVTGPTRTSHGTLTFNWNASNVAGSLVADKYYRVYLQMSDANAAGQWTYVQFEKGPNSVTLNPSNVGNFTNMQLVWTPTSAAVLEKEGTALHFACTPNPVRDVVTVSYDLPAQADVTITLHDLAGKTLAVISDGNQPEGNHSINWNRSGLRSGIYYFRINTGNAVAVQKIVVID